MNYSHSSNVSVTSKSQQKSVILKDDADPCAESKAADERKESVHRGESRLTIVQKLEKCFPKSPPLNIQPCKEGKAWQRGVYKKDSCASGIIPIIHSYAQNRKIWCKTPLSTYQSTIGELGRKILCREPGSVVPRDIRPEPPCNICEDVLPPCRGFYRQYDCIRPCEEEYATVIGNRRIYRNKVSRYWDPCTAVEKPDVNELAPHNGMLAKKLHRGMEGADCW